eukprot:gene11834-15836_t
MANNKFVTTVFSFIIVIQAFIKIVMCIETKILVLGGTGFVGNRFIEKATERGYQIVSLSRRGEPSLNQQIEKNYSKITWLKGDATNEIVIKNVFDTYGPFDACVHAIGLLFDNESGLNQLNKFVSGSGSQPDQTSTYDKITRKTAFNAIDSFVNQPPTKFKTGVIKPFIFVSAAEAGWTFRTPVAWLEKYLAAKRSVENKLLGLGNVLRPVIFRPSLIWTWDRPQAIASVIPLYIGSYIGLPFVDKPVMVDTLVNAILISVIDVNERGIKRFPEMEIMSNTFLKQLSKENNIKDKEKNDIQNDL